MSRHWEKFSVFHNYVTIYLITKTRRYATYPLLTRNAPIDCGIQQITITVWAIQKPPNMCFVLT